MSAMQQHSDADTIRIECEIAQVDGVEITTHIARSIASEWHGGQGSAFYSFASCGHYDRDALLRELSGIFAMPTTRTSDLPLNMLGTYLINRPQS